MEEEITINKTKVKLLKGDITEQDTDAIVNAANPTLMGGGGVDGAIHRAGGPKILEECRKIVERKGSCPTGEAVITGGGNLKARFVIHTVGPVWQGGKKNEEVLLARAYENSLSLAASRGITSVSFPSISTGAYRFPVEKAAETAARAVFSFIRKHHMREVRFVLFSDRDLEVYVRAAYRVASSLESL